jgi:oligopeptide/dipeptide ABC transporter ATP-binding protein
MADEVIVMYLGYVVEQGPADQVLTAPQHPYTRALLDSVPKIDAAPGSRLNAIRGMVPTPDQMPPGCPFHTRCDAFMPGRCDKVLPDLWPAGEGRWSRCHLSAPEGMA